MSDDEREKYPSELAERFQVRLPPGLRDRIKADAEKHGRSMNAEIVARLEDFPNLVKLLGETTRKNSELRDDKERLEWELDKLEALRDRFHDKDGNQKPVLAVPQPLLDRIRLAAAQNYRTLDAEAVAALEEAFPPKSIDLDILASFLDTLVMPFSDEEGRADYDRYIEDINDVLSKLGTRWTVKSDPLGPVAFYPYPSPKSPTDEPDEE